MQIKAWRFVLDEGNYWLLTAMQGALGALAITGNWIAEGDVAAEEAAEIGQTIIDSLEPTMDLIGLVFPFAGDTSHVPDGALLCDGASYLRTNFPDLFSVIGTTYGAADGTHFNVPDLRGRTVLGVGAGSGLSPYSLAQQVGEENHTLTVAELAAHSHTDVGHTHVESIAVPAVGAALVGLPIPSAVPGVGVTGVGSASLSTDGGGSGHNTIQPSIALNYLIVAVH